jgi:PAS domain S-box-containing protein
MTEKRILIVEDERIVAEDLKRLLQKLGYAVTGVASSGEEALEQVRAAKPDLVLMDIRIQGPQDGIEVAERLYAEFDVPVSYLTAYADALTLERAKATMPFGYILKPFEARSLQTVIELALHRHKMETMLGAMDGWHALALNNLTEAVIGTDGGGLILFMNKAAETLTGWAPEAAFGKPLSELLLATNGKGPRPGNDGPAGEMTGSLAAKSGASFSVKYTRTPLPGEGGEPGGVLIVIKEAKPFPLTKGRGRS